jgi:GWxTD domain-containing protein
VGLIGCAKSFNPDVKRGAVYTYKEGYPEVRFTAIGLIGEDGQPTINIAADIVYGSLIYHDENGKQVSDLAVDVQIIGQGEPNETIASKRYTLQIEKEDKNIIYSQDTYGFQKEIPVDPGQYKINFTLTDLNSNKQITSSSQTFIPDPDKNVINLTAVRMMGKNMQGENSGWSPITTYDVPGRVDSLKFMFQVTNSVSEKPLTINSRLLRFKSDTSHARPMHYNNLSPSSIQYRGIDYDKEKVLQSTQRKLIDQGNVFIEFTFAQQIRGNYRFEVQMNIPSKDSETYKARDFSVKSKNYPAIQSASELAKPLAYLMNENEYKKLMQIDDPDSLKAAVDRFWLRHIGNMEQTRNVIQKFYSRVEEANKQFSNFKEGWKTDPGMMYVLFGPPWYVTRSLDEMQWSFAYNRSDPERNFYFYQPRFESELFPFQHYLLQRSQSYFSLRYQQVELWLSGLILQRNL